MNNVQEEKNFKTIQGARPLLSETSIRDIIANLRPYLATYFINHSIGFVRDKDKRNIYFHRNEQTLLAFGILEKSYTDTHCVLSIKKEFLNP